jgi:hypothetical protein
VQLEPKDNTEQIEPQGKEASEEVPPEEGAGGDE